MDPVRHLTHSFLEVRVYPGLHITQRLACSSKNIHFVFCAKTHYFFSLNVYLSKHVWQVDAYAHVLQFFGQATQMLFTLAYPRSHCRQLSLFMQLKHPRIHFLQCLLSI